MIVAKSLTKTYTLGGVTYTAGGSTQQAVDEAVARAIAEYNAAHPPSDKPTVKPGAFVSTGAPTPVTINVPGFAATQVNVASASDAQALAGLLAQLSAAARTYQ